MNNRELNTYENEILKCAYQGDVTKKIILSNLLKIYLMGFFRRRTHAVLGEALQKQLTNLVSNNNTVVTESKNYIDEKKSDIPSKEIFRSDDIDLSSIYKLINEYKLDKTVNTEGDFIELLNAYFNFFPEDLKYIAKSPFHKIVQKNGDFRNFIINNYIVKTLLPSFKNGIPMSSVRFFPDPSSFVINLPIEYENYPTIEAKLSLENTGMILQGSFTLNGRELPIRQEITNNCMSIIANGIQAFIQQAPSSDLLTKVNLTSHIFVKYQSDSAHLNLQSDWKMNSFKFLSIENIFITQLTCHQPEIDKFIISDLNYTRSCCTIL